MSAAQTLTIGNQTFALAPADSANVMLTGKTATDRKLAALHAVATRDEHGRRVSEAAVVAMSYGAGKVATQARDMRRADDSIKVVETFARGDLQGLAATCAATLGESVRFAKITGANGEVIKSAWESVREFKSVIDHKLLQLSAKDKMYTAKGDLTAAAKSLEYVNGLITATLARKEAIQAEDNERREAAKLAKDAE